MCGRGADPACLRAVSTGTADCGQSSRRWYYSTASGDCQPFVYAGCGGNENNFLSYEECDLLCKRTLAGTVPDIVASRSPDLRRLLCIMYICVVVSKLFK